MTINTANTTLFDYASHTQQKVVSMWGVGKHVIIKNIHIYLAHPTTAQAKDVISVVERNFSSSIDRPDLSSLNKRNELVSSCRHRNKALLRLNI